MPSEKELIMYQKSTIYDIIRIIKNDPDKTYTTTELEALLNAYVEGLEQK